jgi:hypothetical protein
MPPLWQTIVNLVDKDADKLLLVEFGPGHVDQKLDPDPMDSGRDYFRLWLSEMFIRKEVKLFQTWYPAVHSMVRFQFADLKDPVEIPNIADSTKVIKQDTPSGDVVAVDFPLTPLMPFSGGVVDLSAGLVGIKGANLLNSLIKVMSDFAGLLAVPQLSAALSIAGPLANGVQELFSAGNGSLLLGLHRSWVGKGQTAGERTELREGYFAVIGATEQQVDTKKLWIVGDRLREGTSMKEGEHKAFTKYDHMLFKMDVLEQRDDWDKLTYIQQPFQQAIDALVDDEKEKADSYLRTAVVAALKSPDLTRADRRRVVSELKKEYDEVKDDLGYDGLAGSAEPVLGRMMKRAMSVDLALEMGEPTLEEVFGE